MTSMWWLLDTVLSAFETVRKATVSFVMSVRLSGWNNSAPTERIFVEFYVAVFFEKICWENSSLIKVRQE
jgi:hypothetical protein